MGQAGAVLSVAERDARVVPKKLPRTRFMYTLYHFGGIDKARGPAAQKIGRRPESRRPIHTENDNGPARLALRRTGARLARPNDRRQVPG